MLARSLRFPGQPRECSARQNLSLVDLFFKRYPLLILASLLLLLGSQKRKREGTPKQPGQFILIFEQKQTARLLGTH